MESIGQTATRFHVSYSFVWKLIKGYEQTGKISPKPYGGAFAKAQFFAISGGRPVDKAKKTMPP